MNYKTKKLANALTGAFMSALAALVIAGLAAGSAHAKGEDCPEGDPVKAGSIVANAKTVGFIVSARWGEGTLTLNDGSQHRFHASGVKLIETGASEVDIKATVYNLDKLEDFEGDYGTISGGLTLIKGITGGAVLSNDNCVYIHVDEMESAGVKLSAPAPGGILIEFEE